MISFFLNWLDNSVFPTIFFEIYILSHHKIQVPTSLVAEVILIRYYILKPIKSVFDKILKKLAEVNDFDTRV